MNTRFCVANKSLCVHYLVLQRWAVIVGAAGLAAGQGALQSRAGGGYICQVSSIWWPVLALRKFHSVHRLGGSFLTRGFLETGQLCQL